MAGPKLSTKEAVSSRARCSEMISAEEGAVASGKVNSPSLPQALFRRAGDVLPHVLHASR
jgi:hypothetical protein